MGLAATGYIEQLSFLTGALDRSLGSQCGTSEGSRGREVPTTTEKWTGWGSAGKEGQMSWKILRSPPLLSPARRHLKREAWLQILEFPGLERDVTCWWCPQLHSLSPWGQSQWEQRAGYARWELYLQDVFDECLQKSWKFNQHSNSMYVSLRNILECVYCPMQRTLLTVRGCAGSLWHMQSGGKGICGRHLSF
jgi:hypothetical protein